MMFGVAIAEAVAIAVLIIVVYVLLGEIEGQEEGVAELLEENNELRLKIGELMCKENVRQQIGRWSA